MSDQQSYPVAITEPWPRQRSRHLIVCLLLVFVGAIAAAWFDTSRLDLLQSYYLRTYIVASFSGANETGTFDYLQMTLRGREVLPLPPDVEPDGSDGVTLTDAARAHGASDLVARRATHARLAQGVYPLLKETYFQNRSLPHVFPVTLWTFGGGLPLAFIIGPTLDYQYRRKLLRGVVRTCC